ncbi:MAG: hypothetical protein ACJA0P_004263, partial [Planctomycetota bacterium]
MFGEKRLNQRQFAESAGFLVRTHLKTRFAAVVAYAQNAVP